jgi:ketosteroid isomerase-like protein
MSEENVENIRQAVEAFNRRDADAFVALTCPDVEWEDAVFWSEGSRTWRGIETVREWFAQVTEPWASSRVKIDEIVEASEDQLVIALTLTARGKGSGAETQLHFWQVNRFAAGKTAARRVFGERAEALEAAGLRE